MVRSVAQGDGSVATVNGEAIALSEFYDRLQHVNVRDFIVTMTPLTVRTQTAGQVLLDRMINERLTLQWAGKTSLMPPDAEVDAEVARAKSQPQVQQAIASHQLSEEVLKLGIRFQKALYNIATTGTTVSPQDVEKYYKDHIASYSSPERISLEAITTTKQPDTAKIQADLKAGKPFVEVLKAYSDDPGLVSRNGVMGTFAATDASIPAPIREAAAPLKDGQFSPPVKLETDPGGGKPKIVVWWIIRMAHREPPAVQPFPAVKAQAEQAALLEKAGGIRVADKKILDFRQLSDIKINLLGYDALIPKQKQ